MNIYRPHNSVHTVLAVMFVVQAIDVQCHPAISQNVVKTVVILPDQLRKEDILLLGFRDFPVQPFIIGSSGNIQLLTHPPNTPALTLIEMLNCYVLGLKSYLAKPHIR